MNDERKQGARAVRIRAMAALRPGVRPEIQGLRALAVGLVVTYHLWPEAVPGGYAGVDVFFVISGYLITAHLLKEAERTRSIDLTAFWARRARRLLPASLLVVLVSAVATFLVVPETFWRQFFKEMGAAVFYVLNWMLANDAVDYLAAENNASPVQHYWSLSVEEQFYVVWPLLVVLALSLATRRSVRAAAASVLGATAGLSLISSVLLTETAPASAYFITVTRAWEFGLGALLALMPVIGSPGVRNAAAWLGLLGIVVTGFGFNAATPFPGWAALLPTVSTALVIAAGDTTSTVSVSHYSRLRPIQYLGDISYSVYLWHWPIIVILPYALARDLTGVEMFGVLVATLVLAGLTKRFVEDPFRRLPALSSRKPRATLIATVCAMAIVAGAPALGFLHARSEAQASAAEAAAFDPGEHCLGANAMLDDGCEGMARENLIPRTSAIKDDTADAYSCYTQTPEDGNLATCTYGDGTRKVALTGDSHAAMLLPALRPQLASLDWSLDTYLARGCSWAVRDDQPHCGAYRAALSDVLVSEGYDAIVVTTYRAVDDRASREEIARQRAAAWKPVLDAGIEVLVVSDNPALPEEAVDCVAINPDAALAGEECVLPPETATTPLDPQLAALELEPRATLVDTRDLFCSRKGCPMVVGGVVVYRDQHHMTASFARTVGPTLAERIEGALSSQ